MIHAAQIGGNQNEINFLLCIGITSVIARDTFLWMFLLEISRMNAWHRCVGLFLSLGSNSGQKLGNLKFSNSMCQGRNNNCSLTRLQGLNIIPASVSRSNTI